MYIWVFFRFLKKACGNPNFSNLKKENWYYDYVAFSPVDLYIFLDYIPLNPVIYLPIRPEGKLLIYSIQYNS